MATPEHIARAARQAALRVEKLLVEMLLANESGEVAIEVHAGGLQPLKRVEKRAPLIKLNRGHHAKIESVT